MLETHPISLMARIPTKNGPRVIITQPLAPEDVPLVQETLLKISDDVEVVNMKSVEGNKQNGSAQVKSKSCSEEYDYGILAGTADAIIGGEV